jgi:hypothetical protein
MRHPYTAAEELEKPKKLNPRNPVAAAEVIRIMWELAQTESKCGTGR